MNLAPDAVWFVTGCSSGLGRSLARHVLDRGYRCVVTARDPSTVEDVVEGRADRAFALKLDVADDGQRREAVRLALDRYGAIDVLVNNAGYAYYAGVEEGDDDEIRAMFETNFFGLAALVRLVLPAMRERGRGHVVNVSSVAGLSAQPSGGYYAATKFAVEALSEALWKEAEPLGVRVTLIEPGPFRTDFVSRGLRFPARPIDAYAATAGARREELRRSSGRQAGDPDRAAVAIVDAVASDAPPHRLLLGNAAIGRVREKLAGVLAAIDEWEAVSRATDFDAAPPRAK
jgi:NAD(P)-dependent dehydrogenase (short-subunit alcohol dehydrogenase family)